VLNGSDIGWLKEVLATVDGFVEETPEVAHLKPVGRDTTLIKTPSTRDMDKVMVFHIPGVFLFTQEGNNYLEDHDYFDGDDGQPIVEDEVDQVTETAAFFMEGCELSPKDPKFAFHFRAFLHNLEYSYNRKTIAETIKRLEEME
jgi:hypothetical protein